MTDLELMDRADLVSIEVMIMKAQLLWTGHVIRMDSSRITHQLLYGVLAQGRRNLGRPKKRYKDSIKENLKYAGVTTAELERSAQDRWLSCSNQLGLREV